MFGHYFGKAIMLHNIGSHVLKLFELITSFKESMASFSLIEPNGRVWNESSELEGELKFSHLGVDWNGATTIVFDPGGYLAEVLLNSHYDLRCCHCLNLAGQINEIFEVFLLQDNEGAAICELLKSFDMKGKLIFGSLEDKILSLRKYSRQYKRLITPLSIAFPYTFASVLSFGRLLVILCVIHIACGGVSGPCLRSARSRKCNKGGGCYKGACPMEALPSDSTSWGLKMLIGSFGFVNILIFDPKGEGARLENHVINLSVRDEFAYMSEIALSRGEGLMQTEVERSFLIWIVLSCFSSVLMNRIMQVSAAILEDQKHHIHNDSYDKNKRLLCWIVAQSIPFEAQCHKDFTQLLNLAAESVVHLGKGSTTTYVFDPGGNRSRITVNVQQAVCFTRITSANAAAKSSLRDGWELLWISCSHSASTSMFFPLILEDKDLSRREY